MTRIHSLIGVAERRRCGARVEPAMERGMRPAYPHRSSHRAIRVVAAQRLGDDLEVDLQVDGTRASDARVNAYRIRWRPSVDIFLEAVS